MKTVLTIFAIASIQVFAQNNEHQINRRNFVSLNTDLSEMTLVVHYPGGSEITRVCGFQLRTNIPSFANSHMGEVLKDIRITDDRGAELVAKQSVAEPPVIALLAENVMDVHYKVASRSGKSLRSVIREAAIAAKIKFTGEPDVIVIAKHCNDHS